MGLLSPLFLLGLAGISLPILFHMIRRTPKGQMLFSSLMFLQPTPPQVTRRSQIENLLLLILRAAALALLAFAFARPFFREASKLDADLGNGRRVAIVVDVSASMQQQGAWRKVRDAVDKVLDDLKPGDRPALFLFDQRLRTAQDFPDPKQFDSNQQRQLIREAIRRATPTWRSTDIGEALVQAADVLASSTEMERDENDKQIVLITDMQRGAALEGLQATVFPQDVLVDVRTIAFQPGANASIQILAETEAESNYRVRIVNGEDATTEQFSLHWLDRDLKKVRVAMDQIYVAPGQNRVVQLEKPTEQDLICLQLEGDASALGNRFYVLNSPPQALAVTYLGEPAESPTKPLYFFRRALSSSPNLTVDFQHPTTTEAVKQRLQGIGATGLIAISGADLDPILRSKEVWDAVEVAVRNGAHLMWVVSEQDQDALQTLLGDSWRVEPGFKPDDGQPRADSQYAMWTNIVFEHPLFAPFSNPRFSDFTGVRFWAWRQLTIPDDGSARVLARFDRGGPAIVHTRFGTGDVYVWSSGWAPAESQLALSTKFVPLIHGSLPQAANQFDSRQRCDVGSPINALVLDATGVQMKLPGGELMDVQVMDRSDESADGESAEDGDPPVATGVARAGDMIRFGKTDRPGIYELIDSNQQTIARYAVNVSSREADTAIRDVVELEQYGVQLGTQPTRAERLAKQRQMRDVQLEKRQQLWRWGIALALLFLLAETLLAGHTARKSLQTISPETSS